ncbi:MAG TPA: hypothetical protein PL009_09725, partial [Flavipsychrobacter sp.]|nr:hypothetical protein [Flavipsychrobacter sp.]
MIFKQLLTGAMLLTSLTAAAQKQQKNTLIYPDEKHFKNVRQLTFGGDNAEAYFGYDDDHIIFQRTHKGEGIECDQIF